MAEDRIFLRQFYNKEHFNNTKCVMVNGVSVVEIVVLINLKNIMRIIMNKSTINKII